MPAYLIYFCHEFRDKQGHLDYAEGVKEMLGEVGAKVLAAYTKFEVLEGHEPVLGAVVIEFPSYEIAKTWYESPEYVTVRGRRIRNSYTGILIEGGSTPLKDRFPHIV